MLGRVEVMTATGRSDNAIPIRNETTRATQGGTVIIITETTAMEPLKAVLTTQTGTWRVLVITTNPMGVGTRDPDMGGLNTVRNAGILAQVKGVSIAIRVAIPTETTTVKEGTMAAAKGKCMAPQGIPETVGDPLLAHRLNAWRTDGRSTPLGR